MSARATITDFSDWIECHLLRSVAAAEKAVSSVESDASAHGRYQSGSTVIRSFDADHREFDAALENAFSELKRATRITTIEPAELRRVFR